MIAMVTVFCSSTGRWENESAPFSYFIFKVVRQDNREKGGMLLTEIFIRYFKIFPVFVKIRIYHTFELTNGVSCWYNYDDIFHSACNFITPGSSYLNQLQ